MSGSAEKTVRRDLRRAIGAEALKHIDAHSAALDHHTINMDALYVEVNRLKLMNGEHAARQTALSKRLEHLEAFPQRTWRERLRWIFSGR